jgi:hypothetical protein
MARPRTIGETPAMCPARPPRLNARQLNRALITRQLLAERAQLSPLEAIEHLVGLQAQAPKPPYFALFSRIAEFHPARLSALLVERKAVRIGVMRGTVHLVSARDCVQLRPLTRQLHERLVRTDLRKRLPGLDPREVADAGLTLLAQRPHSARELGGELAQRWPDRDPATLSQAVRYLCDVVQVPPRGVWGQAGRPVYATAESWLGRPLASEPCVDTVMLRYLGAFGPASALDAQTWSGLTGLSEVFGRLRPQLRVFTDESGRELYDLPEAPRPDPATPLPARFIAEHDNLILSHADRTRVIAEADRKRIASRNGQVPGTILLDGMVRGVWKAEINGGTARLTVTPFAALSDEEERALAEEGERLLDFAAQPPCATEGARAQAEGAATGGERRPPTLAVVFERPPAER